MALYFKESSSVVIKGSKFSGFNVLDYSALTARSDITLCNLSIIDSQISENWSSNNGGGVYSENYRLIIDGSEISFNEAKNSGGGVYFISPECKDCGFNLEGNTKIFNNSCSGDGGAIKWEDYKPSIGASVSIFNNSAEYGADFASSPAKFGLLKNRRLSDLILTTLSYVPPGKKMNELIQINILDTYGQVVKTENSIIATLIVNDTENSNVTISGTTSFKALNGVLNIKDFVLTGVPGSNSYLKLKSENFKTSSVRNDDSEYSDFVYIKVEFRKCTMGEEIQATACIDCTAGKYTLEASENCLSCPSGATCTGGSTIIVNNGYWRSSLESDVVYVCDVFDACKKGNETNELGNCGEGYTGVLCKSCNIGYSKTANTLCTKCPDKDTNFTVIVFLCIGIIILSILLVKTTLTSAFSQKSLHSIYIKIFTNYLQLVFIVTQFDLEWPVYAIKYFTIQRATASFSDQLLSLDCYIENKNVGELNLYSTKLLMISALPILIAFISYIYWIFHSGIFESNRYLKREAFATIIILFFLVYPTILKSMFSHFSCIEIDKMNSYINENTSIECWDTNHKKFSYLIVIPSIILWAIGIPTLLLLLMSKNRRRLHLDYYRVVFGFLYNGYKQRRFYWEFMIMYRKILLVSVSVFQVFQARILQALNVILILLASIYLHHAHRPFNSNQLKNMEMQALNIAAITIYFGLYYLSKVLGEPIKILLFIFIVLGNSYFIVYWAYYMGKALIDIFIKFFPRFRLILKRGDPIEEEFYQESVLREGVIFNSLEEKNSYTFMNVENTDIRDKFNYVRMQDLYLDIAITDFENLNEEIEEEEEEEEEKEEIENEKLEIEDFENEKLKSEELESENSESEDLRSENSESENSESENSESENSETEELKNENSEREDLENENSEREDLVNEILLSDNFENEEIVNDYTEHEKIEVEENKKHKLA